MACTELDLKSSYEMKLNYFVIGISFVIGFVLGLPVAYFAFSLVDIQEENANFGKFNSTLESSISSNQTNLEFSPLKIPLSRTQRNFYIRSRSPIFFSSKDSILDSLSPVVLLSKSAAELGSDKYVQHPREGESRQVASRGFIPWGESVRTRSSTDADSHTMLWFPAESKFKLRRKSYNPTSPSPELETLSFRLPEKQLKRLSASNAANIKNQPLSVILGNQKDELPTLPKRFANLHLIASKKNEDASNLINTNQFTNNPLSRNIVDLLNDKFLTNSSKVIDTTDTESEVKTNDAESAKLSEFINGVYWSSKAEDLVPAGFDDTNVFEWRQFLNSSQVLKIEEGCGRMQNRLIILDDGERSCCRYRHNNDQIQGEIFSFYLGRILGLTNLLPSVLTLINTKTKLWFSAASQVALAQWNSERPVVLTKFIEGLEPAYIPVHFRNKTHKRLHPIAEDILPDNISELVQWSDLIIFDYLTANLDRTVNNMFNERWNPDMMRQPTHNLARTKNGLLVFFDNESGLLHGYRLLEKYEHFHRSLLDGLCVFRRKTADAIESLHQVNNVGDKLMQAFTENDNDMTYWLPFLPDKSIRILKQRISTVYEQVMKCKSKFMNFQSATENSTTQR